MYCIGRAICDTSAKINSTKEREDKNLDNAVMYGISFRIILRKTSLIKCYHHIIPNTALPIIEDGLL